MIILFTGSGIYKQQQQDIYTQLTEGESVYITEDTTLVCVSSVAVSSGWYYNNADTGVEERITEGTEIINSRGFSTLSLETTSRAGHYVCRTLEVTGDTYVTGNAIHRIIMSVPVVTTTTHIPTVSITTGTIYTTPTTTKSLATSEIIVQQTTTILQPQTQPHSSGYLLLPRYACKISACSCLCCSVCLLPVP